MRTSTGPAAQAKARTPTTSATPTASAAPLPIQAARPITFRAAAGLADPPGSGFGGFSLGGFSLWRRGTGFGFAHAPISGAAPRSLAPEVGRSAVVLAPNADAAPGPVEPVGDVGIPRLRPELRLQRIDPPAAARPAVEKPVDVDRVAGAGLGPVDEVLLDRVAGPAARSAAGPCVDRRADRPRRVAGSPRSACPR